MHALALPLRLEVFVREQGVPEALEHDEDDFEALHAVIVEDGKAKATGRLLFLDQAVCKIGRLAVKKSCRGLGLGRQVLMTLYEIAEARGARRVHLHAQCDAERFYERAGFQVSGEPFMEAGIKHVLMVKQI